MPKILDKHAINQRLLLRDVRPASVRVAEFLVRPDVFATVAYALAATFVFLADFAAYADVGVFFIVLYHCWVARRPFSLTFKLPRYANLPDPHNPPPGKPGAGKSDGILYLGNVMDRDDADLGKELWLTNNDARTHIVYLGTTGSGKTEGLKAIVTNSLAWGSGFVYVDGKADTDLWVSLYSLARRFGRDDDLLVLNYMTANSDEGSTSNSMNPFSNGSASYLSNMIVQLMPDAGGDNAMWKERAVALMFALMPALTWKRDNQGLLLDVGVLREYIELPAIIRLSRDPNLPERILRSLKGYLNTLPGYVDAAFDDEGNERPPSPDQPMYDLQVARQQHGYLSMQFTRALQSLADEYGYIFKVQLADVDMLDVVLNRRILVVLIPSLEKSADEAANLGKIVAASMKGMMGATLGNTVEGTWEDAIGSKQSFSSSSFMTVFDEVGYYTARGMAVMAAQARSLGFSLIFAAQDLPAMEKRVKQEAQSIMGNCSLKIFGKLEDPTASKKFLDDHAQDMWIVESNGMTAPTDTISSLAMGMPFYDNRASGSLTLRKQVTFTHLKDQREGEAHMMFLDYTAVARLFYAAPQQVAELRVHRFLPVPSSTTSTAARERAMTELASRMKDPEWTAASGAPTKAIPEITALAANWAAAMKAGHTPLEAGVIAVAGLSAVAPSVKPADKAATPSVPIKAAPGSRAPADRAGAFASGVNQPLAQEGDEYAFMELEKAPKQQPPPQESAGFVPQGMDLDVVTRPGVDTTVEEIDIMSVKLPDDMAAMLKQLAHRLNEGLGGDVRN
jgi:intracellular multiplication protein IcmO